MPKTEKYEQDGWSPITVKAGMKNRLKDFRKTDESWTGLMERLLTIAEKQVKTNE